MDKKAAGIPLTFSNTDWRSVAEEWMRKDSVEKVVGVIR